MGEGGTLALVNGTPYRWKRTEQGSYQMNTWNFPESIEPGTVSGNYVEFDQGWTKTRSDTNGAAIYSLEGTDCMFRIQARDSPSNISVELVSLKAANNPRGSVIQLGWRHDGIVSFVLSGQQGSFHTTNPPVDWMQQNLTTLGSRPLSQICMLGTHNSGMSYISHTDVPGGVINPYVLCQSARTLEQLMFGARYFDVRPQISAGGFWTGHYAGKVGGRGESIGEIISAVNQFLSRHSELVILNFSRTLQTDVGDWREFNNDEWRQLIGQLMNLKNRYVVQDETKAQDLSLLTLGDFIGNGQGAVICVIDNKDLDLSNFKDEGFYKPSQLNVRNEFSDKDDVVAMINDQIAKMEGMMPTGDKRLFLLSWTLTQQAPNLSGGFISILSNLRNSLKPIRELAYSCNKELMTRLLPEVSSTSFPNVVFIDYIDGWDYAALVMAINDKVFNN